jgi:hypothetical protein
MSQLRVPRLTLAAVAAAAAALGTCAPAPRAPEAAGVRQELAGPDLPTGPRVRDRAAPWEVLVRSSPEEEQALLTRWRERRQLRLLQTTVVYLNFDGGTIDHGDLSDAPSDTSSTAQSTLQIPPFVAAPWGLNRQQVIDTIKSRLETIYTGYDIVFTTTRPSSGDYMMTMLGGTATDIGREQGILGLSRLDCTDADGVRVLNLNPLDVNFICTAEIASYAMTLWDLIYVIAHENAHTFGLAHVERVGDVMYFEMAGGDQLTWGAGPTRAADGSSGNCSAGENYQDDQEYLEEALGPASSTGDVTPPQVAITAPTESAVVGDVFSVTVTATDEGGVTAVELWLDGALGATRTAAPYVYSVGGLAAGNHTLRAAARDAAGNVGQSAEVTVTVDNQAPTACATDGDCPAPQQCQDGRCLAPPANAGTDGDAGGCATAHGAPRRAALLGLALLTLGALRRRRR